MPILPAAMALVGAVVLAVGFSLRKQGDAPARVANGLIALGLLALVGSIALSGFIVGRSG